MFAHKQSRVALEKAHPAPADVDAVHVRDLFLCHAHMFSEQVLEVVLGRPLREHGVLVCFIQEQARAHAVRDLVLHDQHAQLVVPPDRGDVVHDLLNRVLLVLFERVRVVHNKERLVPLVFPGLLVPLRRVA